MPQKVFFLIPYPLKESPSQRFRFEQYFHLLKQKGFQCSVQSFLNSHNWQIFFKSGKVMHKIWALIAGFIKRFLALFYAPFCDFIFIHREVTPIGPPVFEWIITRIFRKKIIYDFDDAIWLTDRNDDSLWMRFAKGRNKVRYICKCSYKVSCGNEYLAAYARNYNTNVIVNPTTIDTTLVHNPELHKNDKHVQGRVVIGWTGSHSTLKYLLEAESVLRNIETRFPQVQIVVIADRKPDLKLKTLHFSPWNANSEVEDLLKFDIGIMPLPNDPWTKGKCGFKALQYMALKIPALASPVGVNTIIIDNGVNGFLCNSSEEWEAALTELIENESLRKRMGELGRSKVLQRYSVESNSATFLSLFD